MNKKILMAGMFVVVLPLQGCITDIVTVPLEVAYGATKAVVKGTVAVVGAVIPDGDDKDKKEEPKK